MGAVQGDRFCRRVAHNLQDAYTFHALIIMNYI